VPALSRLTRNDIDALVQARHPEPRSVLGYHEFARPDAPPVCVVRVFEPDAVAITVCWEDDTQSVAELTQLHELGLFEGRIPYRRPLEPYLLQIRYRSGAQALKHDPYFFAPQLSEFDLHLSARATTSGSITSSALT